MTDWHNHVNSEEIKSNARMCASTGRRGLISEAEVELGIWKMSKFEEAVRRRECISGEAV